MIVMIMMMIVEAFLADMLYIFFHSGVESNLVTSFGIYVCKLLMISYHANVLCFAPVYHSKRITKHFGSCEGCQGPVVNLYKEKIPLKINGVYTPPF